MQTPETHPLSAETLKAVFVEQLSILYSAKEHLISCLPQFMKQATFQNLKLALSEDLSDTKKQMSALQAIFHQLGQSAITADCLAMDALVKEAEGQVTFNKDNFYASDMSIIFYMNVIEHMQVGACRVLKVIAQKPDFIIYAQLITESLDMNKDNAKLFKVVAQEYLGLTN